MKFLRLFENASSMSEFIQKAYQEYDAKVPPLYRAKNTNITDKNLIVFEDKIVVETEDYYVHMESHNGPTNEIGGAPGSYFTVSPEKAKECIRKVLVNKADSISQPKDRLEKHQWLQVDCGSPIGVSVVQYSDELKDIVSETEFPTESEVRSSDPNVVDRFIESLENCVVPEGYKKYFYMRGKIKEGIIIKNDNVQPTSTITVMCEKLTEYEGKPVFLILTAYADEKGGPQGKAIPNNRMLFPQNGFYFSVSDQFYNKVESEPVKTVENKKYKYLKTFESFEKDL